MDYTPNHDIPQAYTDALERIKILNYGKPPELAKAEQRIYKLEQENEALKIKIEHDKIEVEAAKAFLDYIGCEFDRHIPNVFKIHQDRHWAELGKMKVE